jgi:hypothetical protein
MKKILILLLSIGLFGTAQAQFGIRAGLSSANFSDTNFNAKLGFHAGGYYQFDAGFLSIEPGLQYAQKGYEGNEAATGAVISEQLSYLDVPVLFRLNFLPFLNVFAGPQASVLLSRNYELAGNVNNSTDVVRGYDLGGVVGIGVGFPLGLNAQLSYDLGLTSLNYFDTDVKNRVLKISIGYDF